MKKQPAVVFYKKYFLKISQNLQENTPVEMSYYFPVDSGKCLRPSLGDCWYLWKELPFAFIEESPANMAV